MASCYVIFSSTSPGAEIFHAVANCVDSAVGFIFRHQKDAESKDHTLYFIRRTRSSVDATHTIHVQRTYVVVRDRIVSYDGNVSLIQASFGTLCTRTLTLFTEKAFMHAALFPGIFISCPTLIAINANTTVVFFTKIFRFVVCHPPPRLHQLKLLSTYNFFRQYSLKEYCSFPMNSPFYGDLASLTRVNKDYRHVLKTTKDLQLVLMSLLPGEEIGFERHNGTQFIRVEEGEGYAIVENQAYELIDDIAIIIPPHAYHNIKNTSAKKQLKLYTIYSPPQHPPGTIEKNKPKEG